MPLTSRRTTLVAAGLALLIALVYYPVLRFDFVSYDDPDYVTENRIVQRGFSVEGLKWAFGRVSGERTYWHPLTWMSHMLDIHLFGVNPHWHHAVNVLFHIANSILLLVFLSNLTGAFWPSAAVAAIFAVHPLQVETVAWVTERKNLLSTLFWLLASGAYVKFARTKNSGPYLGSLALFACAIMSKPAVVAFPCALLLLDFWPLKRFPLGSPGGGRIKAAGSLLLEKLPFFALSAASSLITMLAHKRIGIQAETYELPLMLRIQNALVSYARYLKKILFPSDLGLIYPHPRTWPMESVLIASLVMIVITIFVLAQLKRRPYLGVGWFWFVGVIVPAIGLVQVGYQAMADRFAYVPIIGILIMIAWAAADLLTARHARPLAAGMLLVGAVVYFGGVSLSQVRYWRDSETLYRRAIAVTERNYLAELNLAITLFRKGNADEAEFHARQAVQAHDKDYSPYVLLGSVNLQRTNFPAAISNYSRALALNPNATYARFLLAGALLNGGHLPQAKEQFLALSAVEQYKPEVHASLGEIFTAEKNATEAMHHYRGALKLRPDWPVVLNNMAWLLATNPDAQLRDGAEAVRLAERACELTRNEVPMFVGTLAAGYAEAGRYSNAVAAAKRAQALAIEKGFPDLAQRNAELLKVYEEQKPFHETQ